jgi:hypothetical protein
MRNHKPIRHSYEKSLTYLIRSDYTGYDPYDGSNSQLRVIAENKFTRIISTYLNKFSPINIRGILRIPVTKQNQALAFIGRAMLNDYELYRNEITDISEHLISESLIDKVGYHCWDAHGFPIQMRNSYRPPGKTDIIGDEAVGRFFLELYSIYPNTKYKEICLSICRSFIDRLLVKSHDQMFFKYTPETPKHMWCYNASAIGAAYISSVSGEFDMEFDHERVRRVLCDIISKQKPDGEWWYSINLETGYEKSQIDFHQGFVLDSLLEYMSRTRHREPFLSSYRKGLEFYFAKQFLSDGRGIYRYPRKYPINIHNQAQGIITFTKAALAGFGDRYLVFAGTIADWTITNMQDTDGHFYYLKYPFFTNKIPYIRWSDASMVYALAIYLNAISQN